jgi:ATP-dependent RNA helicase DDX54/DBP10
MSRRSPSPAFSENEVDIAGALFENDTEEAIPSLGKSKKTAQPVLDLDFNDILNAGGDGGSDDDGDAAFIASRQRSSNRKASNVQGKSVKKGGGFQAMGKFDIQQCTAVKLGLTLHRPQC